ncbi:MAG TPA: hypothetical protein VMH30_12335 [Verrucomicrobiae bacterium]|nr:hypothetical protein [Verrucomicrobiae bacterium]
MPEPGTNPELLRSLGRLARGLSALFWGLPAVLIACAETAKAEILQPVGIVPALLANGLLLFGLWQMGEFQKQERPWRKALDRAKLLAIVNLGLCPFFYWQNRMPDQFYFAAAIVIFGLSSLLFLFNLNLVIKQLGAMLPDETLRHETREFTAFNRWMLALWLMFVTVAIFAVRFHVRTWFDEGHWLWLERIAVAVLLFLALSPLAVTMALIWKTKEAIFEGVFGARG